MDGVLTASPPGNDHLLEAVGVFAIVVQQTTQPREFDETLIAWPRGFRQLSRDLRDRSQMLGQKLPAHARFRI